MGVLMSNIYTTPMISDLVAMKSLGLSMAMVNLAIDLSRVIAIYVFFRLNRTLSIGATMLIIACCMVVLSLFLCVGLKATPPQGKTRNVIKQMWSAVQYSRRNPVLLLYFLYNFLSYIFTYLSSTYVAMFITSFFDGSPSGISRAQSLTADIKGLGNILNAGISGAFGFLADRVPDTPGMVCTCLVMAIGAGGFVLIRSCDGYGVYVAYALIIVGLQSSRVMVRLVAKV